MDRAMFDLPLYIESVAGIAVFHFVCCAIDRRRGRWISHAASCCAASGLWTETSMETMSSGGAAPRIASGIMMNEGMISAYLPFLISGFRRSVLPMRTAMTQLQVARLYASYISYKKHLFGELRNISM